MTLGTRDPARLLPPLGLFVAFLLLVITGTPAPEVVLAEIALAAALGISLVRPSGVLAVAVLVGVGVMLRATTHMGSSDVLTVTLAAVEEMLSGGNPYGHGFDQSTPPGAPFAYGPLALLWYLPALDGAWRVELLVAYGVIGLLALRGRILGLAIYAAAPALIVSATDGSNDTSAGLLILVSLLVGVRAPVAGGVLLALATAFKPYALAWMPGLVGYAGSLLPLAAFLVASVAVWLPATWRFGADSMLWSFRRADELHAVPYYSFAYALGDRVELPQAAWQGLRVAAGVALALVSLLRSRSPRSFVISGAFVFLATMYLGWWSTFAYLAALAPVVCWHLDDWVGLASGRVVWPGDPAGVVSAAVDERWPVRRPDRTSRSGA